MKTFDKDVIVEYALEQGRLPIGLIEKDYVLSVVLAYISKIPESQSLVFKGGTALRKIYFPEYRLSADLDFTVLKDNRVSLKKELEKIQNTELEGISFLKVKDNSLNDKLSMALALQYASKIATFAGKEHIDNIRLDFNYTNKIYLQPKMRKVISPKEFEVEGSAIQTMELEEIICEKVHAIYNRPKPRDLYDLWYLLGKGIKPEVTLINKKLSYAYSKDEFAKHVEKLRPKWKTDMLGLLPKTPNFDQIAEVVLEKMNLS